MSGGATACEDFAALATECRYTLWEGRRMHRATQALACKGSEARRFRARCKAEIAAHGSVKWMQPERLFPCH